MATPQQITRRRRYGVLGLILAAMMAFAAVAFADNLQSDLNTTTGGFDKTVSLGTLAANSSQSQNVFLFVDETSGATNNPTYPFSVTGSKDPSSTFAGAASFSGVTIAGAGTANGQTGQVTWTTPAAQATAQSYSIMMTFDASTTINESPATVTINFSVAGAPADTTPPAISSNVSGTLGNNGWYTDDVTVSWSVTDGQSAISSSSGCDTTTISSDTAGTTLTCTATSAGGTSSDSVTIMRDATDPGITFAGQSPAANAAGWNKTAVQLDWTCTDATSGPLQGSVSQTLSTEGADQSAIGTCEDEAGNQRSDTQGGVDIDLTDPGVTWNGGPGAGTSYYFGLVPAAPTCDATDSLSGPNGCTVSGYGSGVGSHTMTATANDVAGNTGTAQRTYTVLAWTLKGFYQPVDMGTGVLNAIKGGSTVPLKFEIFAGPTELTATSAVDSLVAKQIACDTGDAIDDVEITATGGTSLRYDATAGQFVYNWQTPKKPGTCMLVTMTTDDGSSLAAQFKLK